MPERACDLTSVHGKGNCCDPQWASVLLRCLQDGRPCLRGCALGGLRFVGLRVSSLDCRQACERVAFCCSGP
eukprot:scaffold32492_cov14-Tisochrysis_lutea.AAC.1